MGPMPNTVILGTARTPIGRLGGGLSSVKPTELGSTAIEAAPDGVGGGMESMSGAPYLLPGARSGFRMGDVKALDAMVQDGLRNPFTGKQMFEEADPIAAELEITRPDLDKWALRSHQLAIKATEA